MSTAKKKGRKTKLNADLIDKTSRLISSGNYIGTVCEYLGIGETSFYRWMNEGEELNELDRKLTKEEQLRVDFYLSVKKSSSTAEIRAVNGILQAGEDNWQALGWFLERRFKEKWARKEKIEHSGEITNKNIDLSSMSDDELNNELKKYEE